MALRAFNPCVSPGQRKFRLCMIERCQSSPRVGIVTLSAIRSERSVMLVLVAMAIDARYGSILEPPGRVTGLARQLRVLAQQRKSCEIMIEG